MNRFKSCLLFFVLIVGMSLTANSLYAQTTNLTELPQPCPSGQVCTVFMFVNGVWVKDESVWSSQVASIKESFYSSHLALNRDYIKFDAVYNESFGLLRDIFGQSIFQWDQQSINNFLDDPNSQSANPTNYLKLAYAVKSYEYDASRTFADMITIGDRIHVWQGIGYRVVLVGHSQGTFFTNEAYRVRLAEAVAAGQSSQYPDQNKLSIVNIASAASLVADGRLKYTTQCNDIINIVPGSLPSNVNDVSIPCSVLGIPTAPQSALVSVLESILGSVDVGKLLYNIKSHLNTSYFAQGSTTQRQIFSHLEDSLPAAECGTDATCYLKDSFGNGDITDNWQQLGSTAGTNTPESAGSLVVESQSGSRATLRTRRVFTGPFTASFDFRISWTDDTTIGLYNPVNNTAVTAITYNSQSAITYPAVTTIPSWTSTTDFVAAGYHRMTITKSDTEVKLYVDGSLWTTNVTTKDDGYFLAFDLRGNNAMHVKNLSVYRGVNPPASNVGTGGSPPTNSTPVTVTLKATSCASYRHWNNGTFLAAHNASASMNGSPSASGVNQGPASEGAVTWSNGAWLISRFGCSFDRTSVPAGASITSALVGLRGSAYGNAGFVSMVPFSGGSSPSDADYGAYSFTKLANDKDSADWTSGGSRTTWPLNSAGLSYLEGKTGRFGIGVVTVNDFSNTQPVTGSLTNHGLTDIYTHRATNSDDVPYLSVTYTGGSASSGAATVTTTVAPAIPNANVQSGQVTKLYPVWDGAVFSRESSWTSARGTNTGTWASGNTDTSFWGIVSEFDNTTGNMYQVGQYHLGFNLGLLGTGAVVSSASACVNMYYATNYRVDNQVISIVQSTLTSQPSRSDANKATSLEISSREQIPDQASGGYVCFPLNSSGISLLNRGGTVAIAMRASKDLDNAVPTGRNLFGVSSSKSSTPPYLLLTYTGGNPPNNTTIPTVTTGTVGLFVEGYSGSISCSLNGVSVYAPSTLTDVAAGSYTLSCTAPQGFYLLGVSPSAVQLTAGGTKSFTVTLQRNVSVLAASCLANGGGAAVTTNVGSTVYFSAAPSGGTAPYHYLWTGASTGQSTSDYPTAFYTANYSGLQAVAVRVTDSSSPQQVINVDCPRTTALVSGSSPLTYNCTITPTPISLGATANLLVTASGGVAPYHFYLPGAPYFTVGNQSATRVTPNRQGLITYEGILEDSSGLVVRPSCSVQVN